MTHWSSAQKGAILWEQLTLEGDGCNLLYQRYIIMLSEIKKRLCQHLSAWGHWVVLWSALSSNSIFEGGTNFWMTLFRDIAPHVTSLVTIPRNCNIIDTRAIYKLNNISSTIFHRKYSRKLKKILLVLLLFYFNIIIYI